MNNIHFSFLYRYRNLPNGGNTMGNEPNGICGIVTEGGGV
jgi:hypothetical protein